MKKRKGRFDKMIVLFRAPHYGPLSLSLHPFGTVKGA